MARGAPKLRDIHPAFCKNAQAGGFVTLSTTNPAWQMLSSQVFT
jgi:hypothetical protein